MKKNALILMFLSFLFIHSIQSQSREVGDGFYRSIDLYDWEDEDTFKSGPIPFVREFGTLSDSLSEAYDGITFYVLNDEYYPIRNLADYYYWFTQKYPELFRFSILEYEYYWLIGDEIGMMRFISSCENYKMEIYPIPYHIKQDPSVEAYTFDECNRATTAKNDPGSWEVEGEKFHKSLKNVAKGETVRQPIESTALSGDLNQMRNFVRENRMNGASNSSTIAIDKRSSPASSIKN